MRFLTLFLLFSFVFAAPTTLLTPSDDDFYKPPKGYESADLGEILKSRKVPHQIKSIHFPVKIANTWQILVRSEDAVGNATAVVATIFEPYGANSSRVVSYQVAQDSSAHDCAPSYAYQGGGGMGTIVTKAEMFLIQGALDLGYYVVSPDYEGPISAFTVGKLAGYSTLNSIRAALNSEDITGISPDAEVVLWGYSGGTIASGWAAAAQPDYAEDLTPHLLGAAMGGWVTNVTATAEATDGSIFAGLIPNAIAGLTNQYPKLLEYIQGGQIYSGTKLDFFNKIGYNDCLLTSILKCAYKGFFSGEDRYARDGWGVFDDEVVQAVIDENTLGIEHTKDFRPEIPIFVFHGIQDEVVPFKDAQRVYDVWCDDGIESFEFAVSKSTGHILEVIEGSGAALRWIKSRFEGESTVKGCKRTVRETNLLYPGALTGYADIIHGAVDNIMGSRIGPYDSDFEIAENLTKATLRKRDDYITFTNIFDEDF